MKQHFRYLITVLIILINSIFSIGCDCEDLGGFAYSSQYSNLIIYGEVIKYDSIGIYSSPKEPYSMKVKVLKKIRGYEHSDTIRIFGDYGSDCRPYISTFQPGEKWIFALNKISKNNDFDIFSCGTNYIQQVNSLFIGDIRRSKWDNADSVKTDTLNFNEVDFIINHPEKFPLTKMQWFLENDGLVINCECQPFCPKTNQDSLNIAFKPITRELKFLSKGDSYLIHVKILIYNDFKYLTFSGILKHETKFDTINYDYILKRIRHSLSKLECWKEGSGLYKDVDTEVIIPILLKK